jgi:hypothetical protein
LSFVYGRVNWRHPAQIAREVAGPTMPSTCGPPFKGAAKLGKAPPT